MEKLRKIQILGAVCVGSLLAILFSIQGSTWGTLGQGTWRNTVITWSTVALVVSLTWLMVVYTRYKTAKNASTSWRRVGRSALIVWGALVVMAAIAFLGIPFLPGIMSLLQIALLPSALALPVWTAIAAIKGKDENRLSPAGRIESEGMTSDLASKTESMVQENEQRSKPHGRSSRSAIIAISVVGSIFAIVLAFLGDQWVRGQELNALLNTVELTENEMQVYFKAIDEGNKSFKTWERSGREFAENKYLGAVRQAGGNLATELKILENEWEAISVLPWHSEIAGFRDAYTEHLNAWISTGEFYETAVNFRDTVGPDPYSSDVRATWSIATDAARNLPLPMFASGAAERIEAIFPG